MLLGPEAKGASFIAETGAILKARELFGKERVYNTKLQRTPPKKKQARQMSDDHKAALAEGRSQGRAVRVYLEALAANKPKRGRKRTPDSITKRLDAIAAELGIPASDVEGVATFYSQIFRQPVGRHIIRVCDSMVCYIGGHECAGIC